MTNRERLIKLIGEADQPYEVKEGETCESSMNEFYGKIADYLLENGVILPPCKLDETVYCVGTKCLADTNDEACKIWNIENHEKGCDECPLGKEYTVFTRRVDALLMCKLIFGGNKLFIFGETVFLTPEEAEQALKEREKNVT